MSIPLRPAVLVLALILAGCGAHPAPTATDPTTSLAAEMPTAVLAANGPVTTGATILQAGDDPAPMACLGAVLESLPPQCEGPELVGLDWASVPHEDSGDVRWTQHVQVTGTWDGTRLTLTEPLGTPPEAPPSPGLQPACEAPAGGWASPDPDRATVEQLDAATRALADRDDVVRTYVTYFGEVAERMATDPEGLEASGTDITPSTLLNVVVSGDAPAVEADLRTRWGGALCVVEGQGITEREAARVQDEIGTLAVPGLLGTSPGPDGVDVSVVFDDGSIQRALDARYGAGTVRVDSALRPAGTSDPTG